MDYLIAEASATMLRSWSPLLIPGLAQTENYARAVLEVESWPPEKLTELIRARMNRQSVIGRASLTAIIDQHALERLIGSPATMAEQCAYLGRLAERPEVALHVIPHGVNLGLWGAFDIATRDTSVTVRLETVEDIPSTYNQSVASMGTATRGITAMR